METGQTANFIGSPDLANILGRVTGGSPSLIDGLLRVSNSSANLFLMNPAGMVFGQNARLDLGGSFTATTATGIGFENAVFNAFGTNNYAGLTSLPTSFLFETSTGLPGLLLNEGSLAVDPGESLLLVGDRIVQTGTLEAQGGNISIISVPETGEVQINQDGMVLGLTLGSASTASEVIDFEPLTMLDLPAQLTGGDRHHASALVVEPDGRVWLGETVQGVDSGTNLISGFINAENPSGLGGSITITGSVVNLVDADLNASGLSGGGSIRVGGTIRGMEPCGML
ncbi:MAG: filamentous hemagglutinin N-terminal domain-containing protein [Prochlorotrichaceae cyanobacterium]